jgi:hypothetical protein
LQNKQQSGKTKDSTVRFSALVFLIADKAEFRGDYETQNISADKIAVCLQNY